MAATVSIADRRVMLQNLLSQAELDGDTMHKLMDNFRRALPDEIVILSDILSIWSANDWLTDILGGAHVRIFDNGQKYIDWKGLHAAKGRPSSHAADAPQFSVDGPFCHSILFSKFGSYSWVQLENTPFHGQLAGHATDYVKYVGSGENVGPYGTSHYTEDMPLDLIVG